MSQNSNESTPMRSITTVVLALFVALSGPGPRGVDSVGASEPAVWPQWRGPSRDGQISGSDWPDAISGSHLNRTWRVELGPSYSGPIVSKESVFTTETADAKYEVVRAWSRDGGKQLWEARWEGSMNVPFFAASNGSWIRATPALDDDRLYVAGMRDVLVCLDTKTGKETWRLDFVKSLNSPPPAFGFVCSPLVVGGHVFVQAGASLVKIDKMTGNVVWQALKDGGGMFGSAFSSPYLYRPQPQDPPLLLVQTRTQLAGVDPESGTVAFAKDVPAFQGMNILTPTVINDAIFTSSYGGKSLCFALTRKDNAWTLQERWTNKVQGYMSTPVVIDGYIYLHLRNQRFTCIDAATGKEKWTTEPFGKYWSLVANGSKILALDERGELLLIRANPQKFELLDRFKISDQPTWAHLAVCGNELFVRELNAMSAYRWQ